MIRKLVTYYRRQQDAGSKVLVGGSGLELGQWLGWGYDMGKLIGALRQGTVRSQVAALRMQGSASIILSWNKCLRELKQRGIPLRFYHCFLSRRYDFNLTWSRMTGLCSLHFFQLATKDPS